MSAPWEVWIGFSIPKSNGVEELRVKTRSIGRDDSSAMRYLRADLTCGECKFLKEDSDYSVLCVKHSWEIAAENPACMAFVPKEK